MELNEFIGMENPWDYNFELENMKIRENFKPNENIFERFFTYKVMGEDLAAAKDIVYPNAEFFIREVKEKGYYYGVDCDRCSLSRRIYTALWKDSLGYRELTFINKHNKQEIVNKGFWSDTMNSVITPLSKFVETLDDSQKAKPRGYTKSVRYLLECFLGENQTAFKEALKQTKEYINSYHTLGNFVLIPANFNKYRNYAFEDFADLSLDYLKDGFNLKYFDKITQRYYDRKDINNNVIVIFDKEQYCTYINMCFLWDCVKIKGNSYVSRPVGMENVTDERDLSKFFEISVKLLTAAGGLCSQC